MAQFATNLAPDLSAEIEKALTRWVQGVSPDEANRKVLAVSGREYSPNELLSEVKHNTQFGRDFVAGLCSLQDWMRVSEPNASLVELICASVDRSAKTASIRLVAKKTPDPTEHDPVAKEIGLAAGVIWRRLQEQGESSQAILHRQILTIHPPLFDWAIGWLAREDQVTINLENEPMPARERIGSAAGVIWHALEAQGELPWSDLCQQAGVDTPICDWAIGWLARENKLKINQEKGGFRIGLSNRLARATAP